MTNDLHPDDIRYNAVSYGVDPGVDTPVSLEAVCLGPDGTVLAPLASGITCAAHSSYEATWLPQRTDSHLAELRIYRMDPMDGYMAGFKFPRVSPTGSSPGLTENTTGRPLSGPARCSRPGRVANRMHLQNTRRRTTSLPPQSA